MKIEQMLKDDSTFECHFCSKTTIYNLRGVPFHVFRKIIGCLHEIIGFETMASPRIWTPAGSAKTIVVTGDLSVDGRTRGQKFGVCADTSPHQTEDVLALYIWVHRSLLEENNKLCDSFLKHWDVWRTKNEKRYSIPIARAVRSDWEILLYNQEKLVRFLSNLNGKYSVHPNTLRIMRPTLNIFGHSGDFISPAVIDLHRHPHNDFQP
jgi:hypothetical protein